MSYQIKDQKGIVALLMTVVISILFLLIGYSATLLSIGVQRRSIDADQSVRAYYAADSAVEADLLYVKTHIGSLSNTGCGGPTNVGTAAEDLVITCDQRIVTTNALETVLVPDKLQEYDLSNLIGGLGAGQLAQIRLSWWQDADEPGPGLGIAPNLELISAGYNANAATVIGNPSADIKPLQNLVLSSDPGCTSGITPINVLTGGGSQPIKAQCSLAGFTQGYHYQAVINNYNSSSRWIVGVKARKGSTHLKVEALDSGGHVLGSLSDSVITIDVTARSGNTIYRRIVKKVAVKSGVFSGLDTVLFSDKDICKQMTVSPSGVSTTCP